MKSHEELLLTSRRIVRSIDPRGHCHKWLRAATLCTQFRAWTQGRIVYLIHEFRVTIFPRVVGILHVSPRRTRRSIRNDYI